MDSHVSLEVAEKLKENGFDGACEFWFLKRHDGKFKSFYGRKLREKLYDSKGIDKDDIVRAPTFTNLLNYLTDLKGEEQIPESVTVKRLGTKRVTVECKDYTAEGENPADALANWSMEYQNEQE